MVQRTQFNLLQLRFLLCWQGMQQGGRAHIAEHGLAGDVQRHRGAFGGGVDDFGPGIDFVADLRQAGNFLPLDPTPATIASGETPAVLDWSFNNVAVANDVPSWKTVVLPGAAYVSFYNEAINADAPNPAAARLWQEWIFSDEAQALFLEGNAVPVRIDSLTEAGSVDENLIEGATFGTKGADWVSPDEAQTAAANTVLAERWAAAVK